MSKSVSFLWAKPVWERGMEEEKNHTLAFRSVVDTNKNTKIKLACSSLYQLYVNGKFIATGPARTAHGYYRVDEIQLDAYLGAGENIITVYVTACNIHSFYLINVPGFLCAEIIADGKVIAATGADSFTAKRYKERMKRVSRYSYQRTFHEVYRMDDDYKDYETKTGVKFEPVELVQTQPKVFIEREVYYPDYAPVQAEKIVAKGDVVQHNHVIRECKHRCLVGVPDVIDGFEIKELDENPAEQAGKIEYVIKDKETKKADTLFLGKNEYAIYEFDINRTGLISFEIECKNDVTLYITFDEMLQDGFVNYIRLSAINVCTWHLKKGSYKITTFEPYTFKYLCAAIKGDGAVIKNMLVRSICFPEIELSFRFANENLNKIYEAGVETFRQNTVDVYMDCPSRERAGWLCDSFFTARVEYALTGKTIVEKCFLENFLLADGFKNLPEGMLPMCYPSDFYKESFIPNWAMFYVLQLQEYMERSCDTGLVDTAKSKLYSLLSYFRKFENKDGLLVNLENWIFVEWSDSNKYVRDLNFPTNMLYAKMKQVMGELYQDQSLKEESKKLHQKIVELSYYDGFFHDRAMCNKDKTLTVTDEITETCQYYAFFCGTAAPEAFPKLWKTLLDDFGPERKQNNKWPHISFSNAFIGNYLRLDLLAKYKCMDKLAQNIEGYFSFMAEKTGTLWEHDNEEHSLNHGFASHVIVWLDLIQKIYK